MEKKLINARIPKDRFISTYLTLFNGNLKLTETELNIVEGFITLYLALKADNISEDNISLLLFNPVNRKAIREKYNISSPNSFNNCISSLKTKGVMIPHGSGWLIVPHLIPAEEITFKFDLI